MAIQRRCFSKWFAAGMLVATSLHAQERVEQARTEQSQRFRVSSPGLRDSVSTEASEEAPSSPGDPDLGEQVILRHREKATPFKLFAEVTGFYTTNAALTDTHALEDYFLVAQVGVTYQAKIVGDLYGEVTVRQSTFRYAEFDDLDFDSLNLGGGLTYIARPLWNTAFSLRYNFNRLTDGSQHDEFFKNHTLTLAAQKSFELSKAHYIYAGVSSVFGWSDPVAPQRDEYGPYLGYHADLTRSLSAELNYRIAYFDYVNGRGDWNQSLGAALKWTPAEWLTLSTLVSGGFNNSNRERFDYNAFSAGVSFAASVSF